MKKLFLLILLSTFSPFVFASESSSHANAHIPKGLPLPGSGVQVVPLSQMDIPSSSKKRSLLNLENQKNNGYIEENSPRPQQLLYMGNSGKITIDEKSSDRKDTQLKKNLSQIKLAFSFQGIPFVEPKDVIGYAVTGMLKKEGWTGIAEFFNEKKLGTCEFMLNNIALSKGGMFISAESVRYDINGKPSTLYVMGSKDSGFLYRVSWGDQRYLYEIECANLQFEESIKTDLIKFAQRVDHIINQ